MQSLTPPGHRSSEIPLHVAAIGLILATLFGAAVAASDSAPVTVTNARIRLLPGDLPLAGYFDLRNRGTRTLTLTAASSPAFGMVHLHLSRERNGTSTMAMVEGIDIPPGATVHIAPGGYHLMLMQRTRALNVGDRVPMILKFKDGRMINTLFVVNPAGTE